MLVDLRGALLGLADLPAGWQPGEPSASHDSGLCGIPSAAVERMELASAAFVQPVSRATVTETLTRYEPGSGRRLFTMTRSSVTGCNEWRQPAANGTVTSWQVTVESFPSLGDDTLALRLTTETPSANVTADTVYVRRGDVILSLAHVSLGQDGPDRALTESLVRDADARLSRALTGR
jgi:hypothetical protein